METLRASEDSLLRIEDTAPGCVSGRVLIFFFFTKKEKSTIDIWYLYKGGYLTYRAILSHCYCNTEFSPLIVGVDI